MPSSKRMDRSLDPGTAILRAFWTSKGRSTQLFLLVNLVAIIVKGENSRGIQTVEQLDLGIYACVGGCNKHFILGRDCSFLYLIQMCCVILEAVVGAQFSFLGGLKRHNLQNVVGHVVGFRGKERRSQVLQTTF